MALPSVACLDDFPAPALADRFRAIGLDRACLKRLVERGDSLRHPLAPTREALFSDAPEAIAARMFFCAVPVPAAEAVEALGGGLFRAACSAGLLVASDDGYASPFHLRIAGGILLFSDYLTAEESAVMGAGETTGVLYGAARPSSRVGRVLDLGCGAGTLALLLSACADEVVATDVNPRATALARFNATVNGLGNVRCRAGSLYRPVAGERFDLIVSQPPYYAQPPDPAGIQTFLHGGAVGDEVARRVVEDAPQHLHPRGRAIVFTAWPEGRHPSTRPGVRMVVLLSGRLEKHGRQSLNVIEHAPPGIGWLEEIEVAADCWDQVRSWRIDQLLAAGDLLNRAAGGNLPAARLRLPPGAALLEEDGRCFLRCGAEWLVDFAPLEVQEWDLLRAVDRAPSLADLAALHPHADAVTCHALRRGILHLDATDPKSQI